MDTPLIGSKLIPLDSLELATATADGGEDGSRTLTAVSWGAALQW